MAYSKTYTLKAMGGVPLMDSHEIHPAEWTLDILDDQGNSGSVPVTLLAAEEWLELERIDTSDDKAINIIGEQATIKYEYTGLVDVPLPNHFFDADERRFRLEIYQNGTIRGVYYIRQDSCKYQFKAPPYTVTLTAVDGLAFIKTLPWNAYTDAGLLDYRWMSLYEIMIERGLLQIIDDTEVNVINTIRPENIVGDDSFLNDLYVHSDQFIDFVEGPDDVYTMLEKICRQFYLRLHISQNKIWIERLPDMNQSVIVAENYISGVLNPLPLPTINRTIGDSTSGNDATIVDGFADLAMFPAIKKVKYSLNYKAINQLSNFDWSNYTGTYFPFWNQDNSEDETPARSGSGTIDDPYVARLPYTTNENDYIAQKTSNQSVFISSGDIIQFVIPYYWANTSHFRVIIYVDGASGSGLIFLNGDGTWFQSPDGTDGISIDRSGRKRNGNTTIKSVPAPGNVGIDRPLVVRIYYPTKRTYNIPAQDGDFKDDPLSGDYVDISPVSLGISTISSAGRNIIDINNSRVSSEKDSLPYNFIDTGISTISNTIAVSDTGTPSDRWSAAGAPADKQDIERHMADANIDQYARAVYGFEGDLYSNTIDFWHKFTFDVISGKTFIMMTDRYIVPTCTHTCNMQEILPENGAITNYQEFDIEDSND